MKHFEMTLSFIFLSRQAYEYILCVCVCACVFVYCFMYLARKTFKVWYLCKYCSIFHI